MSLFLFTKKEIVAVLTHPYGFNLLVRKIHVKVISESLIGLTLVALFFRQNPYSYILYFQS